MRRLETEPITPEGEAAFGFRRFFAELDARFPERSAVIERLELALLSKEHLLLTGPPGSGKSSLVAAALGGIRDASGAPSLYARQLTEATVQADLVGPVDFKVLTETGRTVHLTDEGMLGARFAFLDEIFDGRDMLLRSILNVLHERELKHGRAVTPGLLQTAILTSNRSLSEVLDRAPELMLAFADRIAFSAFVPHGFGHPRNRAEMLEQALAGQRPTLTSTLGVEALALLQAAVTRVEVPSQVAEGLEALSDSLELKLREAAARTPGYHPARVFSQRGLVKAQDVLRAAVIRDRIRHAPERPLVASLEDLEALRATFTLGGPEPGLIDRLRRGSVDPRERAQLDAITLEQQAFSDALREAWEQAQNGVRAEAQLWGLHAFSGATEIFEGPKTSAVMREALERLAHRIAPGPRHAANRERLLQHAEALLDGLCDALEQEAAGAGDGLDPREVMAWLRPALELLGKPGTGLTVKTRWRQQLGAHVLRCLRLQVSALEAEVLEANDTPMDALEGIARELARALEDGERLAFAMRTWAPAEAPPPELLAALRRRAGAALRRTVEASFHAEDPGPEALEDQMAVLEQLEGQLLAVSPELRSVRGALLAPLLGDWMLRALDVGGASWVEQLTLRGRQALRLYAAQGIPQDGVLDALRPVVVERLEGHAEALARTLPGTTPPAINATLESDAYDVYRQQVARTGLEGAEAQLGALEETLREGGVEEGLIPPEVRAQVRDVSMRALEGRVTYLVRWFEGILAHVPDAAVTLGATAAARWMERLLKSRLPLLVLREGELQRLSHALEAFAEPALSDRRDQALASLQALETQLDALAERLLVLRRG